MADRGERQLRRLFCETGRWMYDRGYVVAAEGSLSARLAENAYLLTPAEHCLGRLQPEQMVTIDAGGALGRAARPQHAGPAPAEDWRLHLTCYRERPDVDFVVHGHPPWCLAASAAGVSLGRPVLPDVVLHVGTIPTAPYATPASQESADSVRGLIGAHDAILLDRHGAVTVDRTLEGALMKLEHVELQARVVMAVESAGMPRVLPREEVQKLKEMRAERSLNPDAVLPDPSWLAGPRGSAHSTEDADRAPE